MEENKKNAEFPKTLHAAIKYFSEIATCEATLVALRWPNGVTCQMCGGREVSYISTRRVWKCKNKHEKQTFSVKKNTIFEDSPIGLDKWFQAVWMLTNCKNGVSSLEVHRALGVTQKTAWFMLHRIRLAMQRGTFEMMGGNGGHVEVDETYIGGLARNMHVHKRHDAIRGTGGSGKQIVMGVLDRGTRKVHLQHIPNTKGATLHTVIKKTVEVGTEVITDEAAGYSGLDARYLHEVINHANQYVNGHVHTNGLENFWSLLKRMLKGTYISVEPFHLFRYLDEEAFRFNERTNEEGDSGRFLEVLGGVGGKRIMYKELIAKNEAPSAVTA